MKYEARAHRGLFVVRMSEPTWQHIVRRLMHVKTTKPLAGQAEGVGVRCIAQRHARVRKFQSSAATNKPERFFLPVLAEYLPILLFLIVAGGIGVALLLIGALLGPRSANKDKAAAYECGFEAFEDAHMQFDVRYYLIAILFIIFDLEIAFLFPWAVVFKQIGIVALVEMAMFLLLLLLGFVYCWKKGALEWE